MMSHSPTIVVVGAGISGSICTRMCVEAGLHVSLIDRGYKPGGRLASKRVDSSLFDVGAQFMTVRTEEFYQQILSWKQQGLVQSWKAFGPDGHERWIAPSGLRSLVEYLVPTDVYRPSTTVTHVLRTEDQSWSLIVEGESDSLHADIVVLAMPAPQLLRLFDEQHKQSLNLLPLSDLRFEPCHALLVTCSRTVTNEWTYLRNPDPIIAWVADNKAKGMETTQSFTFHTNPNFSRANIERDPAEIAEMVRGSVATILGIKSDDCSIAVHRWTYSMTSSKFPLSYAAFAGPESLFHIGDSYQTDLIWGNVESAWLSGYHCAQALIQRFRHSLPLHSS